MRWQAYVLMCALSTAACGGREPPRGEAAARGETPAPAEEKVLNVYNWSDYIAPDTIAKFERATGIAVNYDTYDGNEVLEAKLLAGRTGYDIVVPSGKFMERQVAKGLYLRLDRTRLPNWGNLDPDILARLAQHDPGNAHAVPYMWGTTGIGWNPALVKAALGTGEVESWSVVFDPGNAKKLAGCGIGILDAPSEVLDSALIWLGRDPNGEDPEDLRAAESALLKIRPYVRYFNSSQYIADLASGEICIAIGWGGDVLQARDRAREAGSGTEISYAIPREGALVWFDSMVVPADAPHPRNAHAFIDFILQPQIAAEISDFKRYPSPNAAALAHVDPATRADPAIYPPPQMRARLRPHLADSPEYTRLETRAWTRIRAGE